MDGWSLEYSIDVDSTRSLVNVKIFGVWKDKHAQEYHSDFVEEVTPLTTKPWAKLVDLTGWKTSFPNIVDKIADHMHWCQEHNCVFSVYAVQNPSTFRMLSQMIQRGGITKEAIVVKTLHEAQDYVEKHWSKKGKSIKKI